MEFKLIQTKGGVRVINDLGCDYTLPSCHHSYMYYTLFGTARWQKISEEEFNIIARLSESCKYGNVKYLKNARA